MKQNGHVEEEELTSEEGVKFLEKGNQKWGQEKMAARLMVREETRNESRRREEEETK